MRGSYVLLIHLDSAKKIAVGALGPVFFRHGFYAYAGSALGPGGIKARVSRHRRKEKKFHWHIDYLLDNGKLKEAYAIESNMRMECEIAQKLSEKFGAIPKFGCSDCECESHLFYSEKYEDLKRALLQHNLKQF